MYIVCTFRYLQTTKNVLFSAATDDEAPSWHDILKEKEKKRKPRRRKLKKDTSVNFSDQESNHSLHRIVMHSGRYSKI